MEAIARFLVNRSKVVLAVTALLTLTSALLLFRMSFNPDVTAFLLEGSADGRAFAALQKKYTAGEPIMAMIERKDGGLITERAGLELVLATKDALRAVPGVETVGTLIPDDNPFTGEPFTRQTLDDMPDGALPYLTATPLAEMMISEDKRSVLAVVDAGEDPLTVGAALPDVPMPAGAVVTLAGNPIIFAALIGDLSWFLLAIPPCVVFLLLGVFAANIGSRKLAVLAVVPAMLGSLWTFGLIFALGHQIDLVTIIVPIWVIVMGSADGLHFVTHLQEAATRTDDRVEQTRSALREVGVPMILTTVSTAVGFLSMLMTGLKPMQQLGTFTAIGICFAGLISFFFLPALLSRIEIEPAHRHAVGGRIAGLFTRAANTRAPALVTFLVLVTFASVFVPRLHVNPDQMFFFKADNPARVAFDKLAQAFGGATPMFGEFAWDPQADSEPQLARFRELSSELAALPNIRRVFSLASVVDKVPDEMKQQLLRGETRSPMGAMISDDGMRFVVFPRALTPPDIAALRAFPETHKEVRLLTGQPMLFDGMSRMVMRAQTQSLGYAVLFVALLLLVVYRRFVQTIIAMVPMLVTIATLLGFLAVSGIHLNLLTAIASSVVIGVGIDYVIHLLAAVELQRPAGDGYALRALEGVGRPILANALGIMAGMSALFFSPFKPHTQIALMMWVAMSVGAVTTLLFVPALLPRAATRRASHEAE